jgi:TetR/AcrR family transcriptional regulator, tetracycline repressor protein
VTSETSRRRRGARRVLSQAEVLDAAQELLDDGGLEAVSVRGIAKRLGVAPNTIYTYYSDKAAIMEALVDRLLGEVDHGALADRSQPWRRRIEALALKFRDQFIRHPEAIGLIVAGPLNGPQAGALNQGIRQLFTETGLSPTDAARAAYVLGVYIIGSLALEVARPWKGELPAQDEQAATSEPNLPSPSEHQLTAPHGFPSHGMSAEQYLWGLRKLLDGLIPESAA